MTGRHAAPDEAAPDDQTPDDDQAPATHLQRVQVVDDTATETLPWIHYREVREQPIG